MGACFHLCPLPALRAPGTATRAALYEQKGSSGSRRLAESGNAATSPREHLKGAGGTSRRRAAARTSGRERERREEGGGEKQRRGVEE